MVFINAFEGTDVREKVAHITEFSSALGHLLGMMCDGFGELQSESVEHQQLMTTFVAKIDKHTADIARLHEYNEKQENNKGSHADLMNDLQQFILDFGATSEQLRTELSALRVSTKQELFATQGAIEKLFSEALANMPAPSVSASGGKAIVMTGAPTGDGRSAAPTDTVNHDDALQLLADRLFNLEKKFTVSETNNAKLRLQLDATLQAQDKFDLLTTQIAQQDAQLQAQHDRGRIFEANLLKLKAAQVKNEKSLRDINKKIDYLGSTVQKIIINGQIPMPAPSAAENDEEAAAFDFHFPDTSTLGEDMSVTLETDSIMQDIKTNPTLSRNYLGKGDCRLRIVSSGTDYVSHVFCRRGRRPRSARYDCCTRAAH